MGMRLKPNDLSEIADKVKQLDDSGIEVTQIRHKDHYVWLRYANDGKPGHQIIGISLDKDAYQLHQKVLRGGI